MSQILCTAPGRHGDILWAMATARAISEGVGEPVDLAISQKYGGLADLLRQQAYLRSVRVLDRWVVQETAPMTPRTPLALGPFLPADAGGSPIGWYDTIVDLGYPGWPSAPLPQYVYQTVQAEHPDLPLAPLDLTRPWITPNPWPRCATGISVGFTDEHFELKCGLYRLLRQVYGEEDWRPRIGMQTLLAVGSRWDREARELPTTWEASARWIASSRVFLGCCSALHVLACAIGVPVLLMEPNPHRHHEIFYPYGKGERPGDRVFLIVGNDGLPTFDARHCAEAITAMLKPGGPNA